MMQTMNAAYTPTILEPTRVDPLHGTPFLVMEFFHPRDFLTLLEAVCISHEPHPSPAQLKNYLGWVIQQGQTLVRILEEHHASHVIHRDLKPENILVENNGTRTIFLDYGSAKFYSAPFTPLRGTFFTPGFAPRERAGAEHDLGGSVLQDCYALGAVLYFMLTGNNPDDQFRDTTRGRIIHGRLTPPSRVMSIETLPAPFRPLILGFEKLILGLMGVLPPQESGDGNGSSRPLYNLRRASRELMELETQLWDIHP